MSVTAKRSWIGCALFAGVLFLIVFGGVCYFAGGLMGQLDSYNRRTEEKIAILTPLLDDPRFAHLTIEHSSAAQIYFADAEISEEDFVALKHEVTQRVGRDEAEKVLYLLQWRVNERAGRELHDDGEAESVSQ